MEGPFQANELPPHCTPCCREIDGASKLRSRLGRAKASALPLVRKAASEWVEFRQGGR